MNARPVCVEFVEHTEGRVSWLPCLSHECLQLGVCYRVDSYDTPLPDKR